MLKILITGAAGFIGSTLIGKLLGSGAVSVNNSPYVIGIDNYSSYYSPELKRSRVKFFHLENSVVVGDLCKSESLNLADQKFDVVVHLAAQPGVRESLSDPSTYQKNNIEAFLNVLEFCRSSEVGHLIYASSSSVYGQSEKMPFSEDDTCDRPASFYGATKRANELMAHSYSVCHGLPCTGLRFFTVYGPWGRPDMAYFGFADRIMRGDPISIHGNGQLSRDFTYVDDIVAGILAVIKKGPAKLDHKGVPHQIYNLGNDKPEKVGTLVDLLESSLGRVAKKVYTELPKGDVPHTWANINRMKEEFGWAPKISLAQGVMNFSKWYLDWQAAESMGTGMVNTVG